MSNEGRLEVKYFGVWETVCDDWFVDVDAAVVCNSLGFGLALVWYNIVDSKHETVISTVCNSRINPILWFVYYALKSIVPF